MLTVAVLLAGCGGSGGVQDAERTLDVLAAASLTDPFEELAATFEDRHPGVDVRLSFGSSATLAQQVVEGAPADVLATADEETMARAGDAVTDPTVFATNEIVLAAGDPERVRSVADLEDEGVTYVACVETAPCGKVAAELRRAHGLSRDPVSLESDVRAVLAKVVAGEVDAGFVYVTDARAAEAVTAVPVPGSAGAATSYAVAAVAAADDAALAEEWVELVAGTDGRTVLEDAGFGAPPR